MPDLKAMQALFQGAVMGQDNDFLLEIEDGGRISPERRLHIYQHAYKARLREVLAEDFPVLHSMLGDEAFDELCSRYIDAHPSSHPSLRYFGQFMEDFVRRELPYKNQEIIGEMAHFEWAFHDVFDASDQPYVTIDEVAALSPSVWPTLRFDFHPTLHMAAYEWNVAAVWSSVQDEEGQPTLPEEMPETTYVIQWRRDLRSYFRTLDRDEGTALSLAMDGQAFPGVCESLIPDHGDQAPVRAAELLKSWVQEGLVGALSYMDIEP